MIYNKKLKLDEIITNKFCDELQKAGVSKNSIVSPYRLRNKFLEVDVALIDPLSNEVMCIFEIKHSSTNDIMTFDMARVQLQKVNQTLNSNDILYFLVLYDYHKKDFTIFPVLTENGSFEISRENIDISNIAKFYKSSNTELLLKAYSKTKKEVNKTIDWFKGTCWILAVVVLILGLLNYFKYIELSTTDLALLGAFLALIIMPFSKKLKVLGVEFERQVIEKNEK